MSRDITPLSMAKSGYPEIDVRVEIMGKYSNISDRVKHLLKLPLSQIDPYDQQALFDYYYLIGDHKRAVEVAVYDYGDRNWAYGINVRVLDKAYLLPGYIHEVRNELDLAEFYYRKYLKIMTALALKGDRFGSSSFHRRTVFCRIKLEQIENKASHLGQDKGYYNSSYLSTSLCNFFDLSVESGILDAYIWRKEIWYEPIEEIEYFDGFSSDPLKLYLKSKAENKNPCLHAELAIANGKHTPELLVSLENYPVMRALVEFKSALDRRNESCFSPTRAAGAIDPLYKLHKKFLKMREAFFLSDDALYYAALSAYDSKDPERAQKLLAIYFKTYKQENADSYLYAVNAKNSPPQNYDEE